jgi:hypothetical protein
VKIDEAQEIIARIKRDKLVASATSADAPYLVVVNNDHKQTRINLVPFEEIKIGRERRYLVKGLIPRVGLTVIWGPPKSGKKLLGVRPSDARRSRLGISWPASPPRPGYLLRL